MTRVIGAAAVLLIAALGSALAATERSAAERAAFMRENPCPATGKPRGKCPGWVVDHIVPLCADGPDNPDNMQWQTIAAAKTKDRDERRQCRALNSTRTTGG